jgi:hypothetical protein
VDLRSCQHVPSELLNQRREQLARRAYPPVFRVERQRSMPSRVNMVDCRSSGKRSVFLDQHMSQQVRRWQTVVDWIGAH